MLDVAVPFSAPEKRTLLEPLGSEKSGRVHTVVSCELSETGPLQEGTELDKSRSRQSRSVEFSFRSGQVNFRALLIFMRICDTSCMPIFPVELFGRGSRGRLLL